MKEKLFDLIVKEFEGAEIWSTVDNPEDARNMLMYLYGVVMAADMLTRELSDLVN